jgi:hypothetical protein
MVKKILLMVILVPVLILVLAPKKELWYLAEQQLKAQGLVISGEAIDDQLFGLKLRHPTIYFKGAKIATADSMTIWSVFVYTRATIDKIVVDDSLGAYLPASIDAVTITHTVSRPTRAAIRIEGETLAGEGYADGKKHLLHVRFGTVPPHSMLTRMLKKTEGGWVYEQRL